MKKRSYLIFLIVLLYMFSILTQKIREAEKAEKIYWFIPDGLRAEPDLFKIYEWAQQGELPNIKYLMDHGSYGYSIPTFPSHTPTNFATLLTGTLPKDHGVTDGPIHSYGHELALPSVKGFSSTSKKVPSAWTFFEENGLKTTILSVPGSTPPELETGITIRGRWGGWGADLHAIIFEPESRLSFRKDLARGTNLFFFGTPLLKNVQVNNESDWGGEIKSYSQKEYSTLNSYNSDSYILITDSSDDNVQNYDTVYFTLDKTNIITLKQSQWSEWQKIKIYWKENEIDTNLKVNIIKIWDNGEFRIRLFYDNLNPYITSPSTVSDELKEKTGPMVDFVDNFPPQLIYHDEDKQTFLDEAKMSLEWHKKAVESIYELYSPDVFIHDIYTPNQMLTSRWWMKNLDPSYVDYNSSSSKEWEEVKWMYKKIDDIIGQALESADENTLFILSSDHGAVPLNYYVKINNLLAKEGYLTFTVNEQTGEPTIDWNNTRAIFLKMTHIYIDPQGLGGEWNRAQGAEYEKLREEIIDLLYELKDENNNSPVRSIIKWEDSQEFLDLDPTRVGDLVLANNAGYGWYEEVSEDLEIFFKPLKTGYKQAIFANEEKGMWTPFIIMGPGVKENHEILNPITHENQLPTILKLMNIEPAKTVTGQPVQEVFI